EHNLIALARVLALGVAHDDGLALELACVGDHDEVRAAFLDRAREAADLAIEDLEHFAEKGLLVPAASAPVLVADDADLHAVARERAQRAAGGDEEIALARLDLGADEPEPPS